MSSYAAIDLGATSGRVAVGTLLGDAISYEILHRFPNGTKEDFKPIPDSTEFIGDEEYLE